MNLALEKIIAVIIFLIILVVLIFFTDVPRVFGIEMGLQQELRKCCQAYISHGCPDSFPVIRCNSKLLQDVTREIGLVDINGNADINKLKEFCGCP